MHDIPEGIIPFTSHHLFQYCIENRLFSERKLVQRIQFHDYGVLNRRNVPSIVLLTKHNLNQCAAQSLCLFRNISFILHEYKDQLKDVWPCIGSLLKIVQIVYSDVIYERDLIKLKHHIHTHLETVKEKFTPKLLPKHHFLTHYPRIIRTMGSVKHMSSIRFEAKHQIFKNFSRSNKNFKKLTFTLTEKHQKAIACAMRSFTNDIPIDAGKKRPVDDVELLCKFTKNTVCEVKWIQVNDHRYEAGQLLLHDSAFHKIKEILHSGSNYYFYALKYFFVGEEYFTNSIKIAKITPEIFSLITFNQFCTPNLFEKKNIENVIFVPLDTLEIKRIFQNTL